MLRKLLGAIVILAGIAGCATKPVNVPDNTPLKPTAVIEHHIVNNGIMGMFPFESDERQYFRSNMRRDEATLKGTGTFSGFIVGTRYSTDIIRLDRNVRWTLNADKAEYTECPLKGCVKPAKASPKQEQPATTTRGTSMNLAARCALRTPVSPSRRPARKNPSMDLTPANIRSPGWSNFKTRKHALQPAR